jgi:predicted nucleic acid-binding protein
MIPTYVVDASALLRFLANEPGATEVERLFKQASTGDVQLLMSAVNWAEVLYVVLKTHGQSAMTTIESRMLSLPIQMISLDAMNAKDAAEFRFNHKIPFADSFAGALAVSNRATLVTADFDFHGLTSPKVHLLPTKPKRRSS